MHCIAATAVEEGRVGGYSRYIYIHTIILRQSMVFLFFYEMSATCVCLLCLHKEEEGRKRVKDPHRFLLLLLLHCTLQYGTAVEHYTHNDDDASSIAKANVGIGVGIDDGGDGNWHRKRIAESKLLYVCCAVCTVRVCSAPYN